MATLPTNPALAKDLLKTANVHAGEVAKNLWGAAGVAWHHSKGFGKKAIEGLKTADAYVVGNGGLRATAKLHPVSTAALAGATITGSACATAAVMGGHARRLAEQQQFQGQYR